jgi:GT2 family glycosyltransferase
VVNARSWKFYKMWNDGWRYAAEHGYRAVAFLNDDITLADGSLTEATNALLTHQDYGLVGLNWRRRVADGVEAHAGVTPTHGSYRVYGIGGWAFVVRADLWGVVPPIDEAYHIWYGDDELFASMEAHGYRTGLVVGAPVDHERSTTCDLFPELMAKTQQDHDRFVRRWGHR